MKKTFYDCSKAERKDKIANRMLISLGCTALGFFVSYLMYRVAKGEFGAALISSYNVIMLVAFLVFALACAACYVLSNMDKFKPASPLAKLKVKERFRNYGHFCLVAALISFYVNFAFYTRWLPIETAPVVLSFLKNITKSFVVVFWALGGYAVFTIAYHMYLYYIKKW